MRVIPCDRASETGVGNTFMSAPFDSSQLTRGVCPNIAAICKGVNPFAFGKLMSAPA